MEENRKSLLKSVRYPLIFVGILWVVKLIEIILKKEFTFLGVFPREIYGLVGIVSSPFVHGDLNHLISNSFPIAILGSMIIYFYPRSSRTVLLGVYFITGVAVWILARPVYHIGASGLVYGFAFFLFFSGVFRNDVRSLAISFFIIFMYGGIIWGLLPYLIGISWETHLFGALVGSGFAYLYKNTDLPPPAAIDEDEEFDEINYRYIPPHHLNKEDPEGLSGSNDT